MDGGTGAALLNLSDVSLITEIERWLVFSLVVIIEI